MARELQQGWITIQNIPIPLPAPQDEIDLAAAVGNYCAKSGSMREI